jgi:hypothetical protein
LASETVNLLSVEAGARIQLIGGEIAEVVENPRDGIWLYCRFVSSPDKGPGGEERAVFAQDIIAVLPS